MDLHTLVVALIVALALAWGIAEFRSKAARRVIGLVTFCFLLAVAICYRTVEHLSANWYFTSATNDLIEASLEQLREERSEAVIREWTRMNAAFGATYENRGRYAEIVEEAIEGMRR